MRTPDSTFWTNMSRNLGVRRDALAQAQLQAQTGLRVSKASDDPSAFSQARAHGVEQQRAASYERTITSALPSLETTESTLGEVENVIRRVRDIAVQGANDILLPEDRKMLAQELDGLKEQLVTLGNTQVGDRYIFGGYREGTPPFDAAGAYTGSDSAQRVEVARNVMLPTGVTGDRVFGNANGGQDIFAAITDLQTALNSGVSADISAALDPLDQSLKQVRDTRSEVGLHLNAADMSLSMAQRRQDEAEAARTKLIGIDPIDSYSNLVRAQSALSAAIEIAAQLPPPGLLERSR